MPKNLLIISSDALSTVSRELRAATLDFMSKLANDESLLGLHIERVANARDERVRTGRVTQQYRSVLFQLDQSDGPRAYLLQGVYDHDEAYRVAARAYASANAVTGQVEVRLGDLVGSETPAPLVESESRRKAREAAERAEAQAEAETEAEAEAGTVAPAEPAVPEWEESEPVGQAMPETPESRTLDVSERPEHTGERAATAVPGAPTSGTPTPVSPPPVVPAHAAAGPLLMATATDLVGVLGIDADVAERAARAMNEDELLTAVEGAPRWQSDALLSIADGRPIADVLATYATGVDVTLGAGDHASSDAIVTSLTRDQSRSVFHVVEGEEELRRIIDEGDFGRWRIFLHPDQEKYVAQATNGAFRLSGGAGTGKTVVLVHRAVRLAKGPVGPRVVLTTFTRNLAELLEDQVHQLDAKAPLAAGLGEPGILVRGVDQIAAAVARSEVGAIEAVRSVVGRDVSAFPRNLVGSDRGWDEAIAEAGGDLPDRLRSPRFFESEYGEVVLPAHVLTEAAYLRVRRPGRGTKLGRHQRRAVWSVIDAYRRAAALEERLSFTEVAEVAAEALRLRAERGGGHLADHVLIDEAQDLAPAHWSLMRALVAEGPDDLFIAEDSHQRIYGNRIVLGRYGIRIVGRSRRLTLNYRTTAENLRFALSVLEGGGYTELNDDDEAENFWEGQTYRSARRGPAPTLLPAASLTEELQKAAEQVTRWEQQMQPLGAENIGVLVRSRRQQDLVVAGLGERGVDVQVVGAKNKPRPGIPVVMTMHRAKGMEFSRVLLFGIDAASVPAVLRGYDYDEQAQEDASLRERSLLYVAASRARDELTVTWSGRASELLG